jgi:hypothetical protein
MTNDRIPDRINPPSECSCLLIPLAMDHFLDKQLHRPQWNRGLFPSATPVNCPAVFSSDEKILELVKTSLPTEGALTSVLAMLSIELFNAV